MVFSLTLITSSSPSYTSLPYKPSYSSCITHKPSKLSRRFDNPGRYRIVSLSSTSPEFSTSSKDMIQGIVENETSWNSDYNSLSKEKDKDKDPLSNSNGNILPTFTKSAESSVERFIFDFRFLALLAIGGSLAGSVLCFMNGCVFVYEAYKVYYTGCLKGIHTGQMVLRLVEAIDVYLAGTVMLVFALGLYGLFISNASANVHPSDDRALTRSSLFGMFALKERPTWMKISSLDELKTKVGHVIVMILLVKMFERSKMVTIATGMDLLSYAVCIFLSSASLYILNELHKSPDESGHDVGA